MALLLYYIYVELNFENPPINKDFRRTFVNKHKMNIFTDRDK